VITRVLTAESDQAGVYYDENGKPMAGSRTPDMVTTPEDAGVELIC